MNGKFNGQQQLAAEAAKISNTEPNSSSSRRTEKEETKEYTLQNNQNKNSSISSPPVSLQFVKELH